MTIENAVVARIGSLGTAAGARVYREFTVQFPDLPAVVVERSGGGPRRAFGGAELMTVAQIGVTVLADSMADAVSVADAIHAGLKDWRGEASGVTVLQVVLSGYGEGSTTDGDHVIRALRRDYAITYR